MPIHDWTRVSAGIFHDFHHDWITMLKRALNAGCLPTGYYALAEQVAGGLVPDVLALEGPIEESTGNGGNGVVALLDAPPKVQFTAMSEIDLLTFRKNRIAIRHVSNHAVVAMIEIVSPGNKASRHALRSFVEKAYELISEGVHLLVIDLFPPGLRDPQGIHAAIWSEIEDNHFKLPSGQPLTLVSYSAGALKRAFIDPVAVGEVLPEMPLFLEPDRYVQTPLASTYESAWEGVPTYWQKKLSSEA